MPNDFPSRKKFKKERSDDVFSLSPCKTSTSFRIGNNVFRHLSPESTTKNEKERSEMFTFVFHVSYFHSQSTTSFIFTTFKSKRKSEARCFIIHNLKHVSFTFRINTVPFCFLNDYLDNDSGCL